MVSASWSILCDSAAYLLLGFAVAGVLHAWLSVSAAVQRLSVPNRSSVVWAALVGLPLPLCSCSVLPTAVTLRKQGASKGATLSFLISTPETSVTSILLTYALLGPVMAALRPIVACVTALVAGFAENARLGDDADAAEAGERQACEECGCHVDEGASADQQGWGARLTAGLRFAFVDLFDDIFWWVLVGILAAGAVQAWLAAETLQTLLGGPVQSALLMVVIGVPLYVCAESSTPIAASFIALGLTPGAALVFLLVGPATNIGSLGVLLRTLGRRTVAVYLASIVATAIVIGVLLDALGSPSWFVGTTESATKETAGVVSTLAAVVFLILGLGTLVRSRWVGRLIGLFTRGEASTPAAAQDPPPPR